MLLITHMLMNFIIKFKKLNKDRGHIITGYLRFIENNHPRKLISKGPNPLEATSTNRNKFEDVITKGMEDYSQRLSSTNNNIQ